MLSVTVAVNVSPPVLPTSDTLMPEIVVVPSSDTVWLGGTVITGTPFAVTAIVAPWRRCQSCRWH